MSPEALRAVIVDDEPRVRASLRHALGGAAHVEIVAECGGGAEAIEAIRAESPDVVFLDIMMPEVDGFDVVEAIGPNRMPPVVFVTAHEVGAVRAFEAAAVDYVLKPFDDERILRSLERLPSGGRSSELAARLERLLEKRDVDDRPATRILVPTDRGQAFLPVESIYWLEADGKYVKLHTRDGVHRIRATLRDTYAALDPARFVRVHRSSVLDVDHIHEVEPWFGGDHVAILKTGEKVRVSRNYAADLLRTLS